MHYYYIMQTTKVQWLHNPDFEPPQLLPTVSTYEDAERSGLGYIPSLRDAGLRHGFVWRDAGNGAFSYEPDFPHNDALARVSKRLQRFVGSLGMWPLQEAVYADTAPGDTSIVDVDQAVLQDTRRSVSRGRFISGAALFTDLPGVPMYALAADCSWSIMYAERPEASPVMGLVHAGRYEAEHGMPELAVAHMIRQYGCEPQAIQIGVIPSLEPEHYIIRAEDMARTVDNPDAWRDYSYLDEAGDWHLDHRGLVADGYINAGVPPANIAASLTGTYASAAEGNGFSHRQSRQPGAAAAGRFAVACQLD